METTTYAMLLQAVAQNGGRWSGAAIAAAHSVRGAEDLTAADWVSMLDELESTLGTLRARHGFAAAGAA